MLTTQILLLFSCLIIEIQLQGHCASTTNYMRSFVSIRSLKVHRVFGDNHFCDGIVIGAATILTAANCVTDKRNIILPAKRFLIYVGVSNRFKMDILTEQHEVIGIVVHPEFLKNKMQNIAIIYINGNFSQNIPIQHIRNKIFNGKQIACKVIGWATFVNGTPSNEPIAMNIDVESGLHCYDSQPFPVQNSICASDHGLYGDQLNTLYSGSSLWCDGELTGIISWSVNCGYGNIPRLITDLYAQNDWISIAKTERTLEH